MLEASNDEDWTLRGGRRGQADRSCRRRARRTAATTTTRCTAMRATTRWTAGPAATRWSAGPATQLHVVDSIGDGVVEASQRGHRHGAHVPDQLHADQQCRGPRHRRRELRRHRQRRRQHDHRRHGQRGSWTARPAPIR
ncbi:hypothetical protein AB5I41_10855 [Sphingomonas sp. MMS24-JH45]